MLVFLMGCFFISLLIAINYFEQDAATEPQMSFIRVMKDKVSIHLPEDFDKMSEEKIPARFKAISEPEEVWYAGTGDDIASIVFYRPYSGVVMTEEEILRIAEGMRLKMDEHVTTLAKLNMGGQTVIFLESIQASPTGNPVYVTVRMSILDEQLLMIILYVPESLKEAYLEPGRAVLDSLSH